MPKPEENAMSPVAQAAMQQQLSSLFDSPTLSRTAMEAKRKRLLSQVPTEEFQACEIKGGDNGG